MNPATISDYGYVIELNYPPINYQPQDLRNMVNEILAHYNLTTVNYTQNQDEVILSSPPSQARELNRIALFKNRLIIEKGPIREGTIESFLPVVEEIIQLAINRLRLQIFTQRNIIRIIANPAGINDARVFIGNRVCSFSEDRVRVFGRPVLAIGLRWFFPPTNPAQPEYDVRIETLLRDSSLIFLENKGQFIQPISAADVRRVLDNIRETRNFLTTQIANFLVQFNQTAIQ